MRQILDKNRKTNQRDLFTNTEMRNTLFLILLLTFASLQISCSRDSEVLASFKSGTVTRKELRDYYRVHGAEINERNASIENQTKILENIAIQKIIYDELSKSGKLDNEFIDRLIRLSRSQILIPLYRQEFESRVLRREPMEFAMIQMAVLRSDSNPSDDLGIDILNLLNSAKNNREINEIIRNHTVDNNLKPVSGYLEPYCLNCGPNRLPDFLKEPLENKDKKFYRVVNQSNVYLLRIAKTTRLHHPVLLRYLEERFLELENLAKDFLNRAKEQDEIRMAENYTRGNAKNKAKNYYDLYSKQFKDALWERELSRIRDSSAIKLTSFPQYDKKEQINPKDWEEDRILAELPNGETVRYVPIRDDFRIIFSKIYNQKHPTPQDEIWDFYNFFYSSYLPAIYVEYDPASKSILGSELYNFALETLRRSYAWSLFVQEIANESLIVPEEDIRATYEAGKMFAYSRPDPKQPDKRIPIPYSEARERIQRELEDQKRRSILNSKINLLKTEQDLKYSEKSLKEGEI